ncbi:MAG: ABC transporter ATP-binding protein [Proteobacteria bacterium]|nr:ABC transporter ATP-binding protein [Pseudomonadota bacterium]MBI3498168.1 ABC transporter ATP-binding protein [Pseudomonadota bacterium]
MLEIRTLEAGYGEASVLRGIDLTVEAGEIVALIGANGAGKTTLAKTIAGIVPARTGEIRFQGTRIERLTARRRVMLGISQVPEGRQIVAGLTVRENLELGAYTARRRLGAAGMEDRMQQVCRLFPVLLERLGEAAGNLSGGQQQMLAIARALMIEPSLLVLDEPSLGLSPTLVSEIFRLIERLRGQGLAILLSEQNARMSLAIADRAYVIEQGRIALAGRGRELLGRADIAERYLGVGQSVGRDRRSEERRAQLKAGLARILPERVAPTPTLPRLRRGRE